MFKDPRIERYFLVKQFDIIFDVQWYINKMLCLVSKRILRAPRVGIVNQCVIEGQKQYVDEYGFVFSVQCYVRGGINRYDGPLVVSNNKSGGITHCQHVCVYHHDIEYVYKDIRSDMTSMVLNPTLSRFDMAVTK